MYVVFHSNFAGCIVHRRYKPYEFLEFVWTDCWGNKSNFVITSPAKKLLQGFLFFSPFLFPSSTVLRLYVFKLCRTSLRVNSMQLSLIFWQHFWGQTRSCLPCYLPYTMLVLWTYHLAPAHWVLQKYVKLVKKSWKSIQISCRVNPVQANCSIYWSSAPWSFTSELRVRDQRCRELVYKISCEKGSTSTKNMHVTLLYLKWVALQLKVLQYNDAQFSSITSCISCEPGLI